MSSSEDRDPLDEYPEGAHPARPHDSTAQTVDRRHGGSGDEEAGKARDVADEREPARPREVRADDAAPDPWSRRTIAARAFASGRASQQGAVPPGMKALVVVALVTVCCAGLNRVGNILAPAFFALTLVLAVRPIHRWLMRKGLPPWLSGLSTMAALVGVLLGVVGLMVWSLVGLPDTLGKYKGNFQKLVDQVLELAEKYNLDTKHLQEKFLENLNFDRVVSTVSTLVEYLTSAGALVTLIALTMLFITIDTMTMDFRSRVLANHDSSLHEALCGFEGRVRQYWLVSTIFGVIVAVIDGIVLWVLDVPMPVAWAMVSFITNYIPNIGFVMGVIPPALMALVDSGWVTAVWVVVAYSVINAVIQGIFQPKITGDAVGISTTITFLSLLFWTAVIGPLGAILAVPLTLFAKALLIDSSPKTRWLEIFLIPESEAKKRSEHGIYDEDNPAPDDFVDFMSAELEERGGERGQMRRNPRKSLSLRRSEQRATTDREV